MNIETALKEAMTIDGAIGAAIVDYESGMSLGVLGGDKSLDVELAAAGNTEVIRAKARALASLGIQDTIEDVLITLGSQYHILRPLSSGGSRSALFVYLALDKGRANLALARHNLKRIDNTLDVP